MKRNEYRKEDSVKEKCVWKLDSINDDFFFETECEKILDLDDEDTAYSNSLQYCCFCGKELERVKENEDGDIIVINSKLQEGK